MAEETQEPTYELSDLEVVTLGLVSRAAVGIYGDGENVFLVKDNKEEQVPDELTIEDVTESSEVEQGLFKRFMAFLKSDKAEVSKPDPKAIAQAARILSDGGYEVTAAELAGMFDGSDDEDDDEMEMGMGDKPNKKKPGGGKRTSTRKEADEITEEGGTNPVTEPTTVTKSTVDEQVQAIEKAFEERLKATVETIEKKYEDKLAELSKQVEDGKTEVEKAVEAREKREWLEKSNDFLALAVVPQEAADHLHAIAKAAPDHIEWLMAVLKAADHSLTEAGLFGEIGTSREAEETTPLVKAQKITQEKNIPLAEAMLQLSPAEQAELARGILGSRKEK